MRKITILFLFCLIVDGLLGAMQILTDSRVLASLATISSRAILIFGLTLFAVMVITPRLSKRVLMPPILFLLFALAWSLIYGRDGALVIALLEVMLGLGLLLAYRGRSEGAPWSIQKTCDARPWFSICNFLLTGFLYASILGGLLTLSVVNMALDHVFRQVEAELGGYMTIGGSGVVLEERVFQHGDRKVRLIAMSHIAQSGFYDDITKSLPGTSPTVVLLEGVGDQDNLYPDLDLNYDQLARQLGLISQQDSSFERDARNFFLESEENAQSDTEPTQVEYRLADVDLADFQPETIRFLQTASKLSSRVKLREDLQNVSSLEELFRKFEELFKELEEMRKMSRHIDDDVVTTRNNHLLEEMSAALKTHSIVVVPWGAGHMPEIQKQIEKWGFVETNRIHRIAIPIKNKALRAIVSRR